MTKRAGRLEETVRAWPLAVWILLCPSWSWAQTITRGPFLQQQGTHGIVVVWQTDSETDGLVEYGLDTSYGTNVADGPATRHEIRLEGLQPATSYHYRVVSGAAQSPDGVFCTAPLSDEPFRFVVFGDNRDEDGDHSNHVALMGPIRAEAPAFLINTGDMVDVGLSSSMWDKFFEIERDLLRDVPLWPTFGNHEQWDFANRTYLNIFALPVHPDGEERRYYDFRYSNCHFLVLNTHDILYGTYLTQEQRQFAEESLAAAVADPSIEHIFVVGHHGPYSSSNHGGSPTVRNFVEGLDQLDRITCFFAGHDHCYERWEAESGLRGFVTGGGGAGLYGQDDPDAGYSRFFHEGHHYLVVDVAGDWIRICPKTAAGVLIEPCLETGDQPPACQTPADCEGLAHDPCPGHWTCDQGTCLWVCDGGEPDGGLPDGGIPDAGDPGTGDPGPDSGPQPTDPGPAVDDGPAGDDGTAGDIGPWADEGPSRDGADAQADSGPADEGPEPGPGADQGGGASGGCGCGHRGAGTELWIVLGLFGLLLFTRSSAP